jgi:hypothetical protein
MQTIRTTLNLNAELIERAAKSRPALTRTAIIEEGLRQLLARDAALRLAALGGTAPTARGPRRRRRANR